MSIALLKPRDPRGGPPEFGAPGESESAAATRPPRSPERLESKQERPSDIGFNAAILLGALATGAVVDLAVRFFGLPLPALLFTAFWGSGAILLLLAASASKRRKRAQTERP